MKKSIAIVFGFLLVSILFTSFLTAQKLTSYTVNRQFELINDSETKEIKVEINEDECRFNLNILSVIRKGEVCVEIYNKDGKKQGNFSVSSQICSDNAKEEVRGSLRKHIENAPIGIWTIKIIPKNAIGKISIQYSQDKISEKPNN